MGRRDGRYLVADRLSRILKGNKYSSKDFNIITLQYVLKMIMIIRVRIVLHSKLENKVL